MAFTIKTKADNRYVHSLIQNLADVPGGVTICTADLIPGSVLMEGTVVSTVDGAGMVHVLKSAAVYEAASANATEIKVAKGSQFKVGDFVTDGAKAVAISAINTSDSKFDVLTVSLNSSTGLGALKVGNALEQAAAAASSNAVLKYTPMAMVADLHDVKADDNLWVPAVVIGTFKKSVVPAVSEAVLAKLKGIVLL